MIRYHLPRALALTIARDAILGRRRSFYADARALVRGLSSLRVIGAPPDLASARDRRSPPGGWLVTVNHYSRPGFRAWWIPIVIASLFPCEIRWVMTSTLTFPDFLLSHTYTPLSDWFLPRLARTFDFFSMPPMPPRPRDVAARARAVREVLRFARTAPNPVIGLAPEGGDSADNRLTLPPPGAGRFIAHLAGAGLTLLPVGAFEAADAFCIRFGPPYNLPANLPADADARVARLVFRAIADCLPARLLPDSLGLSTDYTD
jgi:hypothetical protein